MADSIHCDAREIADSFDSSGIFSFGVRHGPERIEGDG
jgi:hypothetical protein